MVELCNIPDCEREIVDEFCAQHILARENMNIAFKQWQHAFGKTFSKDDYFTELLENPDVNTGQWIKDIILYQLNDETP